MQSIIIIIRLHNFFVFINLFNQNICKINIFFLEHNKILTFDVFPLDCFC